MDLRNKVILLRNKKICVKNGHLYLIIKQDNLTMFTKNENTITAMFKIFKNDTEAIEEIKNYKETLSGVKHVVKLDNILDLIYNNYIATLNILAYKIKFNKFREIDDVVMNNDFIFTKNTNINIEEVKSINGYKITYNKNPIVVTPKISLMENKIINKCTYRNILFIESLPKHMELVHQEVYKW